MKRINLLFCGFAMLIATPVFAGTYYGGVEDWTNLDNDYNDLVFSLEGNGLALHSSAKWFAAPALGTGGTPFWNNSSYDGPNDNIGYCIYGGGSCNGGNALYAGSNYLASDATSKTGSANDVTFSATGAIELDVRLLITAAQDRIGWYSVSDPTAISWLNTNANTGEFSFNPGGGFGLVMKSQGANAGEGYTYFSQSWYGSQDNRSHFAFFAQPAAAVAPEPGMLSLVAMGFIAGGVMLRRRRRESQAFRTVRSLPA